MVDFAPLRHLRVQQVQPFTYRDGITFLELLERLATHVKDVLEPSLKNVVDDLVEQFTIEMGEHRDSYVEGVEEFQRIHDAFMADVNAHLMALNDGAVSDLVNDGTSMLGATLRSIFPDNEKFDTFRGNINDQQQALSAAVDSQIAEFTADVDTQVTELTATVDTLTADVNTQVTELTADVNSQVTELTADVNTQVTELTESTATILSGLREEMKHLPFPEWVIKFHGILASAETQRVNLMFFGSSTTRGGTTGNDSQLSYVPRLASMLQDAYQDNFPVTYSEFPTLPNFLPPTGVAVINAGSDGKHSGDYIPQQLIGVTANTTGTGPTVCFHMIGSNDASLQHSPATYRQNMETVLTALDDSAQGNIQHVLIHSYKTTRHHNLWEYYHDILQDIAKQRGYGFIDLSRAYDVLGFPYNDRYNMLLPDGVHQNQAGHAFMADMIRDHLHIPSTKSVTVGHDGTPRLMGFDQFTGSTDTTLTSRSPIKGEWLLMNDSLNWDVTGGYANPRGSSVAYMNAETIDHGVEVTMNFTANTINTYSYGAVVRGAPQDTQSFRVYFHSSSLTLSRVSSSGGNEVLEEVAFVRQAGSYRLRVEAKGRVIAVWVNDQLFMSYDLPANIDYFHSSKTYAGIRASSTGTQIFDDFRVYTV